METTIAAGVGRGLGRIPSARLGTPSLCRGAFISALRQAPRVAEEIRLAKAKRCRPTTLAGPSSYKRRRMLGQSLAWGISLDSIAELVLFTFEQTPIFGCTNLDLRPHLEWF